MADYYFDFSGESQIRDVDMWAIEDEMEDIGYDDAVFLLPIRWHGEGLKSEYKDKWSPDPIEDGLMVLLGWAQNRIDNGDFDFDNVVYRTRDAALTLLEIHFPLSGGLEDDNEQEF